MRGVGLALGAGLVLWSPRVTLAAGSFINIVDANVTLTPTPADYANDYVDATGANDLTVKVKTNSSTGLVLMARLASTSPAIAIGDLMLRTSTPPGVGGTSLTTYTAIGPTNITLWSTGVEQGPFAFVGVDIRIRNISNYDDTGAAGPTYYSNTLVFTVISQ